MRKTISACILFTLLLGAITIESCQSTKNASSTTLLKFNFEKGKGYDYEMIMNMDQDIMGQQMKTDMTTYYSMLVTENDGDVKTVTSTYDRFKMNMSVGDMKMDIDSDIPMPSISAENSNDNPMSIMNRLLGAVKGRKFTMKINAEGKVLEVTGFAGMAKSIMDSLGISGDLGNGMKAQFEQQFNEENIKSQFERVLYIFPNKEIKVGDSWVKNTITTGIGGGKYESTYTVTDIEGEIVTLNEKSKIDGTSEEVKMDGTINGTIIVESKTGLVVSANQEMLINTEAMGQRFNLKANTKTKGKAR